MHTMFVEMCMAYFNNTAAVHAVSYGKNILSAQISLMRYWPN